MDKNERRLDARTFKLFTRSKGANWRRFDANVQHCSQKIADKKPLQNDEKDRQKMVLDAFNQMGGEEVIRSALSEQCAAKYGKSARTWNDVIQEMTQEIFLQKKVSKNNI